MDHDLLLAYLTALGRGDWQKFKEALVWLAEPGQDLYRAEVARDLSSLGHVEFAAFGNMEWVVCPPTLVCVDEAAGARAVLCGGRHGVLLDTVAQAAERLGLSVNVVDQAAGPSVVSVGPVREREDLAGLVEEARIPVVFEGPLRLVSVLPHLRHWLRLCEEGWTPLGYDIDLFDAGALQWVRAEEVAGDGLYRYSYYRPEYRLALDGKLLAVPREIGMYVWLNRCGRGVLRYVRAEQQLWVPAIARMPILHTRAAVLSSGLLPQVVKREAGQATTMLVYSNVALEVAQALADSLEQVLEVR